MAPKSLLPLLLLVTACHGAAAPDTAHPLAPRERSEAPAAPPAPAPEAPPAAPPAPSPDAPAPEPPPPPRANECQTHADCGPGGTCETVFVPACDVCTGGYVIRQCQPLAAACPQHIDCMPPLPPGEAECPPRWVSEHCPDTQITW